MKILVKNSSMVFQKTQIIEKSVTKTFTQSDISHSGEIRIELDVLSKPNLPFEIKVTGDSGVVSADQWNLYVNGIIENTIITNGSKVTIDRNELIYNVSITRMSVAAAGSITVHIKYIDNPDYEPTEITEHNAVINPEHTEEIISLSNSAAAPVWINLKMRDINGLTGLQVNAYFLDSSDNVIGSSFPINSNEKWNTALSESTNVSKVKIQRRDGSIANTTFVVTIVVP